jgi:hypothetical protein
MGHTPPFGYGLCPILNVTGMPNRNWVSTVAIQFIDKYAMLIDVIGAE